MKNIPFTRKHGILCMVCVLFLIASCIEIEGGFVTTPDGLALSVGQKCDCKEDMFYYVYHYDGSGKYKEPIANSFLNEWLFIGFYPHVQNNEIVKFINQTGLFKPVDVSKITRAHYNEHMPFDERYYVHIMVNTRQSKSCTQLKKIIREMEESSIVEYASLAFWRDNRINTYAPYFEVELNHADDVPDLMELSKETNTAVLTPPDYNNLYYYNCLST